MWLQAGPRICLGKEFSYRQMKIVAMTLLRFFRFKLANGTQNVTYRVMFTLHMDKGLPLYAVPRSWKEWEVKQNNALCRASLVFRLGISESYWQYFASWPCHARWRRGIVVNGHLRNFAFVDWYDEYYYVLDLLLVSVKNCYHKDYSWNCNLVVNSWS